MRGRARARRRLSASTAYHHSTPRRSARGDDGQAQSECKLAHTLRRSSSPECLDKTIKQVRAQQARVEHETRAPARSLSTAPRLWVEGLYEAIPICVSGGFVALVELDGLARCGRARSRSSSRSKSRRSASVRPRPPQHPRSFCNTTLYKAVRTGVGAGGDDGAEPREPRHPARIHENPARESTIIQRENAAVRFAAERNPRNLTTNPT